MHSQRDDRHPGLGPDSSEPTERIAVPWESIEPADAAPFGPFEPQPDLPLVRLVVPSTTALARTGQPLPSVVAEPLPSAQPDAEPDDDDEERLRFLPPLPGGGWTLPLLCAGIGLIACCLVIPQADQNRRAAYEQKLLENDLSSIQQQVAVNDEFLKRVNDDPTLAERLAQRQLNIVRAGSRVWRALRDSQADAMSPYQIVNVPRPAPLPPYKPVGGWFAALCCAPRSRLYLMGSAMLMMAGGLVLGSIPRK